MGGWQAGWQRQYPQGLSWWVRCVSAQHQHSRYRRVIRQICDGILWRQRQPTTLNSLENSSIDWVVLV